MLRVFNCGLGMLVFVSQEDAQKMNIASNMIYISLLPYCSQHSYQPRDEANRRVWIDVFLDGNILRKCGADVLKKLLNTKDISVRFPHELNHFHNWSTVVIKDH